MCAGSGVDATALGQYVKGRGLFPSRESRWRLLTLSAGMEIYRQTDRNIEIGQQIEMDG